MKNLLFLLSIISGMILSSCEKDANLKTYTLNLTVNNQSSDSVNNTLIFMGNAIDGTESSKTLGDFYFQKGISHHTYSVQDKETKLSMFQWFWHTNAIMIGNHTDTLTLVRSYLYIMKTQNDSITLTFLND